jgi:hypothetical protein
VSTALDPVIARLERELVAWPDDAGPWDVYVDRLIEIGDPWARWLALHLARERSGDAGEKRNLQRAIRDARFDGLGPELVGLLDETRDHRPRAWITFLHGFAFFARLRLRPKSADCEQAVRVLMQSRASKFLRQLRIGVWDPLADTHAESVLATLAAFPLPALDLLELQIHRPGPVHAEALAPAPALDAVFQAAPRLTAIICGGREVRR